MNHLEELSEQQIANLRTLAEGLKDISHIKAEFDMGDYAEDSYSLDEIDCGSVGCAVGFGPYFGIPKRRGESWREYSAENFIDDTLYNEDAWCFSALWKYVDNTPIGASKRIEWFLEKGVPDDYCDQIDSLAPLCYDTSHLTTKP